MRYLITELDDIKDTKWEGPIPDDLYDEAYRIAAMYWKRHNDERERTQHDKPPYCLVYFY